MYKCGVDESGLPAACDICKNKASFSCVTCKEADCTNCESDQNCRWEPIGLGAKMDEQSLSVSESFEICAKMQSDLAQSKCKQAEALKNILILARRQYEGCE